LTAIRELKVPGYDGPPVTVTYDTDSNHCSSEKTK
jgi:hypothetical protein